MFKWPSVHPGARRPREREGEDDPFFDPLMTSFGGLWRNSFQTTQEQINAFQTWACDKEAATPVDATSTKMFLHTLRLEEEGHVEASSMGESAESL